MKTSLRIKNVYDSIIDGTIPGSFTPDQRQFVFNTITTKDRKGNTSTWEISVFPFDTDAQRTRKFKTDMLVHREVQNDPSPATKEKYPVPNQLPASIIGRIHVTNTTHTGTERESVDTDVTTGKNLGKKNATNTITQALLDAYSLYKNKAKKATSTLNKERPLPMLIKKLGDSKSASLTLEDFNAGIYVERKYDGYRSVATRDGDSILMYSRSGIEYTGLDDIKEELDILIGDTDLYIDGELYAHNIPLQEISTKVRNGSSVTIDRSDLKFYVFDCFDPNNLQLLQKERKEILTKLFLAAKFINIVLIDSFLVHTEDDMMEYYKKFINENYEGAVIRKSNKPYEFSPNNYHSSNALKLKPRNTAEFKIIDYHGGIKGKDLNAVVFILETDDCNSFNAVPTMTLAKRKSLYTQFKENPKIFEDEYKGKMATIQYSILSRLGVPQQPKFITIREEGM